MKKRSKTSYKIAASVICGNPLNLISDLKLLRRAKVDYLHFDVMDGHFVPRFGLYPEILKELKSHSNIPVSVHLMVSNPIEIIPDFVNADADIIVVHAESTPHLHRAISFIKNNKIKAGVALNPATSLSVIEQIVDNIDFLLIMAVNPGIVGHKLIPGMINKIKKASTFLSGKGVLIEVDGGVNFESSPKMIKAGATILVCGTSTIYKQRLPLDKQIKKYRKVLDKVNV